MNLEERNEKVAEWAGFEHLSSLVAFGTMRVDYWYYRTERYGYFLPNFYNSLDALNEYVIPKIQADNKLWTKFVFLACYGNGLVINRPRRKMGEMIKWLLNPMNVFEAVERLILGETNA